MSATSSAALCLAVALRLGAADPTFLHRYLPDVEPRPDDLTKDGRSASYRPIFGSGDAQANQLKGIARYGELTVGAGGESALVLYPAEEQIYYVLVGSATLLYGDQKTPLRKNDFLYLPPGVRHGIVNTSDSPVRLLVMGFKIPSGTALTAPAKLMLANAGEVPLVKLDSHGPTTQFKLLMGTTRSTRDKLAAASQMTSLFLMDFAPGGTNIPHHHEMEEEIYYVLRGRGDMVAGGGADGNEGRYPAREGDAYFIRLNTTVGFYSASKAGEEHDLILVVRSSFPFPRMRQ
ncbi:MAG: cupin domain-containing protein [Candidatus Sulfopaludibacter sp.]|nr:cupin domain-containing protein [Candidatus Sulfopaludibacter sp.]